MQLKNLELSLSPKDREATLSTLRKIYDNIIQHPNDDKYRQVRLTNKRFSSEVWQYPAGKELMKMSGWVVEGDYVRLRDDSCIQSMSQLLESFLSSLVPLLNDEFQVLIKASYNGDIDCIQKLLKVSHISPNGEIYSENGSSFNVMYAAIIAQQMDIVKLLLIDYHLNPTDFIAYISGCTPQFFVIAIMKYCSIKPNLKTK